MSHRLRRLGVSTAAVLLLMSGGVAVADSAQALVSPQCDAFDPDANVEPYNIPPVSVGAGYVQRRCYLSFNSTGNGVRTLQRTLRDCYHQSLGPYGVDGHFGKDTRAALMNVQRGAGIDVDGAFGPQSRNAMLWEPRYGRSNQCYWAKTKV